MELIGQIIIISMAWTFLAERILFLVHWIEGKAG